MQTALIHWLQACVSLVYYETHPLLFAFTAYSFFSPVGWTCNMYFCSLLCAHEPPPSPWFSHFQPMQKHCNAFPWKQFERWGGVPSPQSCMQPTLWWYWQTAPARMHSSGMFMPGIVPHLYTLPGSQQPVLRKYHPAPETCCTSPGREGGAGFPTLLYPRHEVLSLWAHSLRHLCQENDHAWQLWWMRTRHLFCDPLHSCWGPETGNCSPAGLLLDDPSFPYFL